MHTLYGETEDAQGSFILHCSASNPFHGKMFGELKKHCILFGVLGKMCNFVGDKQNIIKKNEQFQCSV